MPIIKLRPKQKILDRHTGASPADRSRHRFDVFRSDLSSFYSFNPFLLCETQPVKTNLTTNLPYNT